jgi:putative Ca2+/H+ antiporter (TMEM165/GDT1 family)
MIGVFAGALLNHGLAVLLGSFIQDYIPIMTLQIVAGFAFVVFALWSLKPEDNKDEETDKLCLGLDICKYCQGNECVVGQIKNIVKNGLEEDYVRTFSTKTLNLETLNKHFDRQKVVQSLKNTVHSIKSIEKIQEKDNIHNIRKNLELILFGKCIKKFENWENYK